ncbi:MAG TPA: carnitine dehydratase, partial [Porticoccaceae bacterium]|nr:carnitine dehydratase [Porticoccaceae bacterium]
VDAGMVDGALSLMTSIYGMFASGVQTDQRASNILDSGAHFYNTYETKDGLYVSIGSIETKFYAELLEKMQIDPDAMAPQMERESWPAMTEKLKELFLTKTRDEWCAIMENTDICFAPVLSLEEAPEYPHNKERNAFVEVEGVMHPAPAPRFSATPSSIKGPTPKTGEHTEEVMLDWGISSDEVNALRAGGA